MNGRRGGEEGRAWKLVCLLLCRHCHALMQRNGCCVCPGPACAGVVGGCALTHPSLYSSRPTYDEQQRMLPTVVEPCCLPLSCGCLCKRRGARSRFGDATHGELPQPAWRVAARRILLAAALSPGRSCAGANITRAGAGIASTTQLAAHAPSSHSFATLRSPPPFTSSSAPPTTTRNYTPAATATAAATSPDAHTRHTPHVRTSARPHVRTPHATRPHVRTTRHTPSPTPSC